MPELEKDPDYKYEYLGDPFGQLEENGD